MRDPLPNNILPFAMIPEYEEIDFIVRAYFGFVIDGTLSSAEEDIDIFLEGYTERFTPAYGRAVRELARETIIKIRERVRW